MPNVNAQIEARVGTLLANKYRLIRVLGAGGMGAVFEAQNTRTERRVAIKVMLADAPTEPELAARFLREARAASKITHPNVVDVLDMGEDEAGVPFIVQEFLVGTDLRHVLEERRALSPRETLEIISPIMSALCAAHRQRVVHRDIKPENIFLVRSGGGTTIPKLIDFGLARVTDADGLNLTKSGAAMGTPYYMSPEQARGERDPDGTQTDVWAIAVVMFEMLAGRCPFEGDSYNAIISKILMDSIPRLDEVAPRVPKSLADVVARGLQRDRATRYPSMARFLGALLDCPGVGDESLRRSMRASSGVEFPDEHTIVDDSLTTTRKDPPREAERPNVSTLGRSAKEIPTTPMRPRSTKATIVRIVAVVAGVVSAGAAVSMFAKRGTRAPVTVAPPVQATRNTEPSVAPSVFNVVVTTRPPTASITLDQAAVGTGAFATSLPRDGHEHYLRVAAAGFEAQTIAFRDEPPPQLVELAATDSPRSVRAITARRAAMGRHEAAANPPASPVAQPPPPAPATVAAPASSQAPRRANGAPVLGE